MSDPEISWEKLLNSPLDEKKLKEAASNSLLTWFAGTGKLETLESMMEFLENSDTNVAKYMNLKTVEQTLTVHEFTEYHEYSNARTVSGERLLDSTKRLINDMNGIENPPLESPEFDAEYSRLKLNLIEKLKSLGAETNSNYDYEILAAEFYEDTMRDLSEKESPITVVDVTEVNATILAELRQAIDKVTPEKATSESAKFASREEGRAAMIVIENSKPAGYLEMKTEEELPEDATTKIDLKGYSHLARIGVIEEIRGYGIGTKLMSEAEKWASQKGLKGIWLEYRNDNFAAKGLYEKTGYVIVGEFTDKEGNQRTIVKKDLVN